MIVVERRVAVRVDGDRLLSQFLIDGHDHAPADGALVNRVLMVVLGR
jgi:hypothetical protein